MGNTGSSHCVFIYYKPLDHIRLAKTSIWTVILIVVSIITALVAYNIADTGIGDYLVQHKIKKTISYQLTTSGSHLLFSAIQH